MLGSRRVSIGWLMSLVAVLALDLAVVRATYLRTVFLAICVTPIGIALHVALYGSVRCKGVTRAFWIGFGVPGMLASATLIGYVHDPHSVLRHVWVPYFQAIDGLLPLLPDDLLVVIETNWWAKVMSVALYTAIPQLLVSLCGGLVVSRFAKRRSGGWVG